MRIHACSTALVLVALVCGLVPATSAQGVTLLNDDFDAYSLGPSPWPNNIWPGGANIILDPDPDYSGDQVLELVGSTTSTTASGAYQPVNFPTNPFVIYADVYNGSEPIGSGIPARAYIYQRPGAGFATPSRTLIGFDANGNIVGSDGTVLTTYSTDTWYHVAITYELFGSNLELRYFIDGAFVAEINQTISLAHEASLDHFQLTAQAGTVLYDDVQIEVVPEPSTGLLLAIGLLGLASRWAQAR